MTIHSSATFRKTEGGFTGTGNEATEEVPAHHRRDSIDGLVGLGLSLEEVKRTSEDSKLEMESLDGIETVTERRGVKKGERLKWWKVYAMHFLFSWNSRTFENVSIFLVALAFPGGLFATSVRGITSTVSTMLFSSAVGSWIDRSPSRISTQLTTISLNHAAIVASYIAWLFWPVIAGWGDADAGGNQGPFSSFQKGILYGVILLLDVVHDLGNIANKLSVERDWVPVLVGPITPEITYGLTQVNSVLVRIEMVCQLCAPLLLPFIMSLNSRTGWILLLAGTTVILWAIELWIARIIARENAELQALKKFSNDAATVEDIAIENQYEHLKPGIQSLPRKLYFVLYKDPAVRLRHYFSVGMWPASIANGMLNLTVLAYSATLITYLLEIGFSLESITVARASGAIMGLSGTVITPTLVAFLRERELRRSLTSDENEVEEDGGEGKIVRKVGFWGISSQFLCMIPVVLVLWNLSPSSKTSRDQSSSKIPRPPLIIPLILYIFLSLSRIGHNMIELMVQELGQVEIPESQRSTFAGTEQSFHSLFALCHWAATVVWSHPGQFRWLALGSLLVVGAGVVIFGSWMRKERSSTGRRRGEYEGIAMDGIRGEREEDD